MSANARKQAQLGFLLVSPKKGHTHVFTVVGKCLVVFVFLVLFIFIFSRLQQAQVCCKPILFGTDVLLSGAPEGMWGFP